MRVSELTDTELNRAMIWLYPEIALDLVQKYMGGDWYGVYCSDHIHLDHGEGYSELFPLKEWSLIMPLMIENHVGMSHQNGVAVIGRYTKTYEAGGGRVLKIESKARPALRAICEVLVMIKLGERK